MRITGGEARGIPLQLPRRGLVRPATDQLRAAIFSSLGAGLGGAQVLDLFGGTGAYGLEALSRGAAHVTWVESAAAAAKTITANLAAVAKSLGVLGGEKLGRVQVHDVFAWDPGEQRYDLVFADPPYDLLPRRGDELLARLAGWLSPGGRLVLEAPGAFQPADTAPVGLRLLRRLGKGAHQPGALIFRDTEPTGE